MTKPQITILLILAASFALFAWRRWRYDLVAVLALLAAVLTQLIPAERAFDGFADPVVVTVAALLVVGAAIRTSGLLETLLRPLGFLLRRRGVQVALLGSIAAVAAAFMSSVGALSVLLPAAQQVTRRNRQPAAPVLAPVALSALLGGFATLVGTLPNLLVSDVRREIVGEGYAMFDYAPVGAVLAVAGVIYLVFAWRLLPSGTRKPAVGTPDLVHVEDYTSEVLVPHGSVTVGQTVGALERRGDGEVRVVAIIREEHRRLAPRSNWTIQPEDVLVLACEPDALQRLMEGVGLRIVGGRGGYDINPERVGVVEAVVTAGSALVGRSPGESGLAERFQLSLLAIGRSGGHIAIRLRRAKLRAGDILVLQGELGSMPAALASLGCLPLAERRLRLGRQRQMFAPALLMTAAIALSAAGVLPIAVALLVAVALLILVRILTLNELYASVAWPVIVLIGAFLPVSAAFRSTGAAELVASWLAAGSAGVAPAACVAATLAVSLLGTLLLNGVAMVLVAAPLAAGFAAQLGVSADPFLMAVAVGASCNLLTPGDDRARSHWRLGLPLAILVVALGVPMILVAWPLH